jgi:hypothetical protein
VMYLHGDAGLTREPNEAGADPSITPTAAGSVAWRMRRMVHLLVEATSAWQREPRRTEVTVAPGVRIGWNRGRSQTVAGIGVPATFVTGHRMTLGALAYFSHELPFGS